MRWHGAGAGKPVGPRKSGSTVGRTPAKRKEYVLDTLAIVFGSAVFGAAVNIFTLGNQIVPGGATGVSIVANYLFGTPVGVVTIIVNIPLFLFALRKMGASFFIKTAVATVVSSLAIDLFAFLPHYTEDRLLATIFGGVMQGAGLSFIYMRGITTGGSDLLSALIRSKFNRLSLGHLLLLVDGAIVLLGSLVYRDVTSAFYSAIMIYISSTVIDAMLAGLEKSKFCFIISSKSEVIERPNHRDAGSERDVVCGARRIPRRRKKRHIMRCKALRDVPAAKTRLRGRPRRVYYIR